MELSITAVSRNRRFTKALVRHSGALKGLEQAVAKVTTPTGLFEVLQIVFVDRDADDYVRATGTKGGRIFQVEVAIPNAETADFTSAAAFVQLVANRAKTALAVANLDEATVAAVSSAVDGTVA